MKKFTGNTKKIFIHNCFKNVVSISEKPYGHHSDVNDVFFRQILENWDDRMDQVLRCLSESETIDFSMSNNLKKN